MKLKSTFEHFTKKFANITFPIESSQTKNKKIGSHSTNFEGQTSLGVMLKRQGESASQTSIIKKFGTMNGRKPSVFQNILDKKRLSTFSLESYDKSTQETLIKETASKIKALFTAHTAHFFGQISENSIKGNAFQANVLGKTPECIKNVKFGEGISITNSPTSFKIDPQRKFTTGKT